MRTSEHIDTWARAPITYNLPFRSANPQTNKKKRPINRVSPFVKCLTSEQPLFSAISHYPLKQVDA